MTHSVASAALAGCRIVDFSRMLAGPFCTQQLADLGADVIKIERPGAGDDSRRPTPGAPEGASSLFLSSNRSKRSVAVDLKSAAGAAVARDLCAQADVVVENFSNGVMGRMGLNYERLREINPRLIYCSITGFGHDDDSERRAYDLILQAASGFMSVTGPAGGSPMRTAVPVIDLAAASAATSAILAAILVRDREELGQMIEVALIDVAVSLLSTYATAAILTGQDSERSGNRGAQSAPSDVFATADGWIAVTCGNDRLFRRLGQTLGAEALADEPAFASPAARLRNSATLSEKLAASFVAQGTAHWLSALREAGVPAAPVLEVSEAMVSEDVQRRGLVADLRHPRFGEIPMLAPPFRFSASPTVAPIAPPEVGEHTDEILSDVLGWSGEERARAWAAGAFGNTTAGGRDG